MAQKTTALDLPRRSVERPHPVTGRAVRLHFEDVLGHGVWTVCTDEMIVGVLVRPYSVVDDPPDEYVALPPGVSSLAAGYIAASWHEALAYLERQSVAAAHSRHPVG